MITSANIREENGEKFLCLELPLHEPRLSGTGRSFVVAETNKFQQVDVEVNGKVVAVSVNAVISAR